MPVERRERLIAIWLGSTGNGRNPKLNGRRQPSCGGTSRMTRECQVRFCEGLGVKFPGPTRHSLADAFCDSLKTCLEWPESGRCRGKGETLTRSHWPLGDTPSARQTMEWSQRGGGSG